MLAEKQLVRLVHGSGSASRAAGPGVELISEGCSVLASCVLPLPWERLAGALRGQEGAERAWGIFGRYQVASLDKHPLL